MTADTGDIYDNAERVAAILERRRAKVERAEKRAAADDPIALIVCRNLCWVGALLGFVSAFGLSWFRWAGVFTPAVGVIHWLVVGMGSSFLGAVTIQLTINQRRTAAGQRRIIERTDAGAARLREEIREAFTTLRVELEAGCARFVEGIDTAAIARLAGQLEAIEASMPALRATADLPATVDEAIRKAHAAGYVSGVQQRLNSTGGTLIPLHKP